MAGFCPLSVKGSSSPQCYNDLYCERQEYIAHLPNCEQILSATLLQNIKMTIFFLKKEDILQFKSFLFLKTNHQKYLINRKCILGNFAKSIFLQEILAEATSHGTGWFCYFEYCYPFPK